MLRPFQRAIPWLMLANSVLTLFTDLSSSFLIHGSDVIAVEKLSHRLAGVQRRSVVAFEYSLDSPQTFIKRVLGIPGDHIRIADKPLLIAENIVEEPYKSLKTSYVDAYRDNFRSTPKSEQPASLRRWLQPLSIGN